MKKHNTYLRLRTQVYDISRPNPPKEAYAFYLSYIRKAAIHGSILAPMCGSGRFLIPMLEEGYNVQGFDASTYMLDALLAKAGNRKIKPIVWNGLIENLNRSEKYSLIFIPSGSICLIIDIETMKTTLKRLYEHLTDDGILLIEVDTRNSIPPLNIWRGSAWRTEEGEGILLSQLAILENYGYSSFSKYELVKSNNIIHTEVEELKVRIYHSNELIEMLTNCGFNNVRMIKAFNHNAEPDESDETIIYECRK